MTIALAVAAALCAYVASKSSSDELHGAYRDSAQTLLEDSTKRFESGVSTADLERPETLQRELDRLWVAHPELASAAIYRPGSSTPVASVGQSARGSTELGLVTTALSTGEQASGESRDGGRHDELLATPLREDGKVEAALVAGYDMAPFDAELADRNRRVAIVLGILLLSVTIFTALVLGRGIFRPLDRLRLATRAVGGGDLATRLGWRRRDELGMLSRDFDAMASDLEENHRRLEELAHRDPLTGLANHRHFQELLGKELESAGRLGTR